MRSYPITPDGAAGLLALRSEPDSRMAVTMVTIGWEADPVVVRRYVPEPLELDGSGLCFLHTVDHTLFLGDRQAKEFISHDRQNNQESFFSIPCRYRGAQYYFMVFGWATRDWLVYLSRGYGMPHKIARVQLTRFHPADPVYYGPHDGVRICLSVENYGLVLRGTVDLQRPCAVADLPFGLRDELFPKQLGWRYVWDQTRARPAFNDLVAHWADEPQFVGTPWTGPATLTFSDAENEEVMAFQPRRVIGGWHSAFWITHKTRETSSKPEVVYEFESSGAAPNAR